MKTIFDHIETVRAQPHHVREKVAFAVAAGGAGVIAVIWFFGVFATGTFAIQDTSFAQSTGAEGSSAVAAVAPSDTNYGVAGAAAAVSGTASAPAGIEIVDAPSTSTPIAADKTYIPF